MDKWNVIFLLQNVYAIIALKKLEELNKTPRESHFKII